MFESLKKQPFKKPEKSLTIGDITDTGFVVDYTKLNKAIKSCKSDKENHQCKEQLKDLGITWIED